MTITERLEHVTAVAKVPPTDMDVEDQITMIAAYAALAEMLEPLYNKYCKKTERFDSDKVRDLIKAFIKEYGEE